MVTKFSPNPWQMMTFLNPLDALIPKIPFSFFVDFWVWVTSEARGSVLVGFSGSHQLSPFWGGALARGLYRPPPLNRTPGCPMRCLPASTRLQRDIKRIVDIRLDANWRAVKDSTAVCPPSHGILPLRWLLLDPCRPRLRRALCAPIVWAEWHSGGLGCPWGSAHSGVHLFPEIPGIESRPPRRSSGLPPPPFCVPQSGKGHFRRGRRGRGGATKAFALLRHRRSVCS